MNFHFVENVEQIKGIRSRTIVATLGAGGSPPALQKLKNPGKNDELTNFYSEIINNIEKDPLSIKFSELKKKMSNSISLFKQYDVGKKITDRVLFSL